MALAGLTGISIGEEIPGGQKSGATAEKTVNPQLKLTDKMATLNGEVRALVEQLAIPDDPEERNNVPDDRYRKAASQLLALQEAAFPSLMEHLMDQRASGLAFTRMFRGGVGEACEKLMRTMLEDLPAGYPNGFSRIGRKGMAQVRPCWRGGGIFEASGGLSKWLKDHEGLSCSAMQAECLAWAVEKEKVIGAPDAESYFTYILPLEIQLLKRKASLGEDSGTELVRLSGILESKTVSGIPGGLLPEQRIEALAKVGKKSDEPAVASEDEAAAIQSLIEQLWFQTLSKPNEFGIVRDPANPMGAAREDATSREDRRRSLRCRLAFDMLTDLKDLAFPFLMGHHDDTRLSPDFHGHLRESSVRISCYLIVRYQLEDYPADYGRYGYQRKGRDGQAHVVPRYSECPFDMDGIRGWLKENEGLSYAGKRIRALQWSLSQEKKIGASDADGYFENILPLEIRILERREEMGENVAAELRRLEEVRDKKLVELIPKELLPVAGKVEDMSLQED